MNMQEARKWLKGLLVVLAFGAIVLGAAMTCGCELALFGAQNISIKVYQGVPVKGAPPPQLTTQPTNGNSVDIDIKIDDGGTSLMGANPPKAPEATTQPSK